MPIRSTRPILAVEPARIVDAETRVSGSLEALLGRQRALILDRLDRPVSCGEIARALKTVPAGATHHLRSLEAAGLVIRRRDGRRVIVERTMRGTALLALYDHRTSLADASTMTSEAGTVGP